MTTNDEQDGFPNVVLLEHSVVLIAENINPSIINPDFLGKHAAEYLNLKTEHPPVSTPVFSQVSFEGGLTVIALPDRISFARQIKNVEDSKKIDNGMVSVRDLLPKLSGVGYKSIGINMKCFKKLERGQAENVKDVYFKDASWMVHRNCNPLISLKAEYIYNDKQITLEVNNAKADAPERSEIHGLLYNANIHRNIEEIDHGKRIDSMATILTNWKNDKDEFDNLVAQFYPTSVSS